MAKKGEPEMGATSINRRLQKVPFFLNNEGIYKIWPKNVIFTYEYSVSNILGVYEDVDFPGSTQVWFW